MPNIAIRDPDIQSKEYLAKGPHFVSPRLSNNKIHVEALEEQNDEMYTSKRLS